MYTHKHFRTPKSVLTIALICLALVVWGIVELTGNALAEPGKGGGKKSAGCKIAFDVKFRDALGDRIRDDEDDGKRIYQHGVDRVFAFTNDGSGFAFDTNGAGRLDHPKAVRYVELDFRDLDLPPDVELPFDVGLRGINLKFDYTEGLDPPLCSLEPGEEPGEVNLEIHFSAVAGEEELWTLSYGVEVPRNNKGIPTTPIGEPVVVTRTGDSTWTIEGTMAGLREGSLHLDGITQAESISMPFLMEVTAQDWEGAPPPFNLRSGLTSTWGRIKANL